MVRLELSDVTLAYGEREVLHGINLVVEQGEMVGLIGPNGSGKSTLVRAISHLIGVRKGRILVNGEDITGIGREELARRVAVVPQYPVLPGSFTAVEVVLMGRTPHLGLFRYEGNSDARIVLKAMEITNLVPLAQRRVGELSGGEKQRLLIARALAQEPKLVLLDEPTAHLDINYQMETLLLFHRLCRQQGLAVVVAVHDLNLAAQFCSRLVLLGANSIYAQGVPQEVITQANIREVYGAEVFVYPHPVNGLPATLVVGRNGENGVGTPDTEHQPPVKIKGQGIDRSSVQ